MRHTAKAIMLAVALGPAAAAAQTPAAQPANPAGRLLAHRAELSLTAEQVKQLEAIDQRVARQGAELREKLEAVRGKPAGEPLRLRDMTPEQRQALQARRAELQPLMLQLRALHVQAAADARGLLTTEQNQQANTLLFAGPGRGQGRGPAAGGAWRRGQGQGRGAGWAPMRRGGWQNPQAGAARWRGGWD